jgi:hypothetical protein
MSMSRMQIRFCDVDMTSATDENTSYSQPQSLPSAAAVVLWPAAFARFRSICVDLLPRIPPPHCRRCSSYLSELKGTQSTKRESATEKCQLTNLL